MTDFASLFAQAFLHIENKNYLSAEKCFLELMQHNNTHAQINLATLYLDPNAGLYRHEEALKLLLDAVTMEDGISATNNLGMIYMTGKGVPKNYEVAYNWFKQGAEAEISACMANMGRLYELGYNGKPNYKAAIDQYLKANKFGYPDALSEIARILNQVNTKEVRQSQIDDLILHIKLGFMIEHDLEPSNSDGSLENTLAEMFDRIDGKPTFKEAALHCYMAAREKGNSDAINNIGAMYLKGEHVKSNAQTALKYFTEAAELGNPHAMKNLGSCYLEGIGTEGNYEMAIHWLKQSVDLGCEDAVPALAYSYYCLNPDDTDEYLPLMDYACDMGHPASLTLLGEMYLEGNFIPEDTEKGIAILKKGSEINVYTSSLLLGIYFAAKSEPRNYADAAKYLMKAVEQSNWLDDVVVMVADLFHHHHKKKEFGSSKAIKLNKFLADKGDAEAQVRLANLYVESTGKDQDIALAVKYAQKSAEQKNVHGLSMLIALFVSSNFRDIKLLNKTLDDLDEATKNGSGHAAFSLARIYQIGSEDIPIDHQLFMKYISRAIELGFEPASDYFKKMPKN